MNLAEIKTKLGLESNSKIGFELNDKGTWYSSFVPEINSSVNIPKDIVEKITEDSSTSLCYSRTPEISRKGREYMKVTVMLAKSDKDFDIFL